MELGVCNDYDSCRGENQHGTAVTCFMQWKMVVMKVYLISYNEKAQS
jgi:hypothetical protein